MYTVTVLLSTYNGEKYLKPQLDSLINQKNVKLKILVRDDGSTDSTLKILDNYTEKYNNIEYYATGNIGPAKSFLDLICKAKGSDFYALCDQDDIWDEDKMTVAIEKLKELPEDKPNLYYSNLRIVDQNLKFYRLAHDKKMYNKNKYSALTENLCTGCTAVFNRKACDMLTENLPEYCTMHDTWVYMMCKLLGNVVYDYTAHISYRQHEKNVVGTGLKKNSIKVYKERFFRIFKKDLQPRYQNAVNFEICFRKYLTEKDRDKILKLIHYKDNLHCRLSLLLDKDIKASSFYGNVRFKLHILWGTV
ncbi:Chondroitin polymerase [uncultured Clostridium sp.]|nr:Chondroitin polymerase [uncultured Clostridium sp.]